MIFFPLRVERKAVSACHLNLLSTIIAPFTKPFVIDIFLKKMIPENHNQFVQVRSLYKSAAFVWVSRNSVHGGRPSVCGWISELIYYLIYLLYLRCWFAMYTVTPKSSACIWTNTWYLFSDDDQAKFIRIWLPTSHNRWPYGKLPRTTVASRPVLTRNQTK